MTDFPHEPERSAAQSSFENWLLAIATALAVLLVLGVLPHVQW